MAPCTSLLTPRKGHFFGFCAGLVVLAYLICAAVQAQTLPQKLQDLGLSFFPGADRIGGSVFDRFKIGGEPRPGYVTVDGISGATITIMVLNASITPAARTVAESRGIPLAKVAASVPSVEAADDGSDAAMWVSSWESRRGRIWVLAVGLLVLILILFLQDWLAWHATFLKYLRLGFLDLHAGLYRLVCPRPALCHCGASWP